jgi:hypothetical protein
MNTTMKLGSAAAAACAACRAVSIVPALMAGTSLVAIGGAASAWGPGIAALAVPVTGLYLLSRRKAAPNANFPSLMEAGLTASIGLALSAPVLAHKGESEYPPECGPVAIVAAAMILFGPRGS